MTEKYPTWLIGHVKEWAEKRLPTVTPVSYTHLDVYKRQLLNFTIAPQRMCGTA